MAVRLLEIGPTPVAVLLVVSARQGGGTKFGFGRSESQAVGLSDVADSTNAGAVGASEATHKARQLLSEAVTWKRCLVD